MDEKDIIDSSTESDSQNLPVLAAKQREELSREATELIGQMLVEKDQTKTQEIISLFNLNQKKKTMARMNKLNDLYDLVTDQAISRFTKKPDEIDNTTLLQALKVIQDSVDKSQKQLTNQPDTPLIQINQQTNELNIGDRSELSKESRDKVKGAVAQILAGIGADVENGRTNNPAIVEYEENN